MTIDINSIITSQDYLSDEIVDAKRAAKDYTVYVSPAFEIDGVEYRVLLDGHHSFAAAVEDGVEAEIEELTKSQHDAIYLLENGNIDDFLLTVHMGDDYRFAATGKAVW